MTNDKKKRDRSQLEWWLVEFTFLLVAAILIFTYTFNILGFNEKIIGIVLIIFFALIDYWIIKKIRSH